MRLHRFFINNPIEKTKILIKDERVIHQWRNVFRYNAGSQVILFDGSGYEFESVILRLTNRETELEIISKIKGVVIDKKIVLVQSLIKKDKMEWVIQKATELGVSKIIPIVSERSEKKSLNVERARKIIIEASEQCGRADVSELAPIISLSEALGDCENAIVFDSSGESLEPEKVSEASIYQLKPLSLFIGPEGGWSEKELEMFKNKGVQVYSLGPLTLRAETATVVALSKFI